MLDRLLSAELDAGVTRRCDPAGFVCQIRVPLEKLGVSAPAQILRPKDILFEIGP